MTWSVASMGASVLLRPILIIARSLIVLARSVYVYALIGLSERLFNCLPSGRSGTGDCPAAHMERGHAFGPRREHSDKLRAMFALPPIPNIGARAADAKELMSWPTVPPH
jgi:hypothetical protein